LADRVDVVLEVSCARIPCGTFQGWLERDGWIKRFTQAARPGAYLRVIEGQLDLERHRGRTPGGVAVRVLRRILALTAAIWHNDHTGQPVMRALTADDH
jgi:MOSC domain-containing protein